MLWFIIIRLIKRCKRLGKREMVAPTHLSLFLTIIIIVLICFNSTFLAFPPCPNFSSPPFCTKKKLCTCYAKIFCHLHCNFLFFWYKPLSCILWMISGWSTWKDQRKDFFCSFGFYFIIRVWLRHTSLISEDQVYKIFLDSVYSKASSISISTDQ